MACMHVWSEEESLGTQWTIDWIKLVPGQEVHYRNWK